LQSGYCAGLRRPLGCGPGEQRSCMFVSPVWQGLGACTCRAEILQGCVGFGGMASNAEIVQGWGRGPVKPSSCRAVQAFGAWWEGEIVQGCEGEGVWPGRDPSLKGLSHRDPAVLKGGSLG
jgi:hypothetical protein